MALFVFDEVMSSIYFLHSKQAWQVKLPELYRAKISERLPTCEILARLCTPS